MIHSWEVITAKVAIVFGFLWIALVILGFMFCPIAKAEPPHPSKHYKWSVMSNGQVILYFLVDGSFQRYAYDMIHEVEPAYPCAPKYDDKTFRLVTFDSTMPYFYTMHIEPVMRWNNIENKYVRME